MKFIFVAVTICAVALYLLAVLRHAGTTLGEFYSDAGNALLLLNICAMLLVLLFRQDRGGNP